MSLAPSLKNRIRRLEQQVTQRATKEIGEMLREARERLHAMTPVELAVHSLKAIDSDMDELSAPDAPSGWRTDMQNMKRSAARAHIASMNLLHTPETDMPSPFSREPYWDWCTADRQRAAANKYVELVALARDLYTPRHWPLPK